MMNRIDPLYKYQVKIGRNNRYKSLQTFIINVKWPKIFLIHAGSRARSNVIDGPISLCY